jgi:hypothetical protein
MMVFVCLFELSSFPAEMNDATAPSCPPSLLPSLPSAGRMCLLTTFKKNIWVIWERKKQLKILCEQNKLSQRGVYY